MARFGSRRNAVARRRSDGRYELVLDPRLRASLGGLLGELTELMELGPDHPGLRRLSPPAYLDDDQRDAEYQLLAGDELRTSRQAAVDAVLATLDEEVVDEGQLWAWLQSLNALRLVVGTSLGIDDDQQDEVEVGPDDPTAGLWSVYRFATWIQYEVVRALQG